MLKNIIVKYVEKKKAVMEFYALNVLVKPQDMQKDQIGIL